MVKPAYDSRTNNNEAQLDIKSEHDITRLLKRYWRIKRGLMIPGGLSFLN